MLLAEAAGGRNSYTSLRLIAALAVLVSHSFPLTTGSDATEPLYRLTGMTLGTAAVGAFFALSGFLITQSFERSSSLASFVQKRVLRLVPGLWVALLLTTLALAPASQLSLSAYLSSPELGRFLKNGLFLPAPYTLPGLFNGEAVNGSLWTLKHEVAAYAVTASLGGMGVLRPSMMVGALLACCLILALDLPESGASFYLNQFATLFRFFAVGSLLYMYRDSIPASRIGVAASVALFFALPALAPACVAYAVLAGGALLRIPDPPGDYSYGIYVYAFPVQQLFVPISMGFAVPWLANIVLAAPVAIALGYLSWRLFEAPAMRFAKAGRTAALMTR